MSLPTLQWNDQSNLLNLNQSPEEYRCIIYAYTVSHEVLSIQIAHITPGYEEKFFLTFSGVLYLCGKLKWTGAILKLNNSDEHTQLVKNCFEKHIDALNSDPSVLDDLISQYRLYEFLDGDSKTQILAGSLYIADNPHTDPFIPSPPQPPTDPAS